MKIIKTLIIVFVFLLLFPLIISLFGEDKPKKTENDIDEKIQVYAFSSSKKYTFEEINENEFSLIENFDQDENISFFVNKKNIEKTNFQIIDPSSFLILNDDNSITPTSNIVYEITYRLDVNILSFVPLDTKVINNEVFYLEENPTSLANGYWQFTNNINFNTGNSFGICAIDSLGNYFENVCISGTLLYGEFSEERKYLIGMDDNYEFLAINEDGTFKDDYYVKFFGESSLLSYLIDNGAKKYVSVNYENVNFDNYTIDENPSTITGGYWKFKTNFTSTSNSGYNVDMYDCFGNHFTSLDRSKDNKLVGFFRNGDNYVELTILYINPSIEEGYQYEGLAGDTSKVNEDYYFYFTEEFNGIGLIQYLNSIATKYILNDGGITNE